MVLIAHRRVRTELGRADTKALEEEEGDEFSWEMGCWKREGWRV